MNSVRGCPLSVVWASFGVIGAVMLFGVESQCVWLLLIRSFAFLWKVVFVIVKS